MKDQNQCEENTTNLKKNEKESTRKLIGGRRPSKYKTIMDEETNYTKDPTRDTKKKKRGDTAVRGRRQLSQKRM